MSATPGPTWTVLKDTEASSAAPSEDELIPNSQGQDMRDEIEPTPPPRKRRLEVFPSGDEDTPPRSNATSSFIPKSPLSNPLAQPAKKKRKKKIIDTSRMTPELVRIPIPPQTKPQKRRDLGVPIPPPATQLASRREKVHISAQKRKKIAACLSSDDEAVVIPLKQLSALWPVSGASSGRGIGNISDREPVASFNLSSFRTEAVHGPLSQREIGVPRPPPRPTQPILSNEALSSKHIPAKQRKEASSSKPPSIASIPETFSWKQGPPASTEESSSSKQIPALARKDVSTSKDTVVPSNEAPPSKHGWTVPNKEASLTIPVPTALSRVASSSKHAQSASNKSTSSSRPGLSGSSREPICRMVTVSGEQSGKRRRSPSQSSSDEFPTNLSSQYQKGRPQNSAVGAPASSKVPSSSQFDRSRVKEASIRAKTPVRPRPRASISASQTPSRRKSAIDVKNAIELSDDGDAPSSKAKPLSVPSKRPRRESAPQTQSEIIVISDSHDGESQRTQAKSASIASGQRSEKSPAKPSIEAEIIEISDDDDDEASRKPSIENPVAQKLVPETSIGTEEAFLDDVPPQDEPAFDFNDNDGFHLDESQAFVDNSSAVSQGGPPNESADGAEADDENHAISSNLHDAPPLSEPATESISDTREEQDHTQAIPDQTGEALDSSASLVDIPEGDPQLPAVPSAVEELKIEADLESLAVKDNSTEHGSNAVSPMAPHSKSIGSSRSANLETAVVEDKLQELTLDGDATAGVPSPDDASSFQIAQGDQPPTLDIEHIVSPIDRSEKLQEDMVGSLKTTANSWSGSSYNGGVVPLLLEHELDNVSSASSHETHQGVKLQLDELVTSQSASSNLSMDGSDDSKQVDDSSDAKMQETHKTVSPSKNSPTSSAPLRLSKSRALYGGRNGFFKDIFKQQSMDPSHSSSSASAGEPAKSPVSSHDVLRASPAPTEAHMTASRIHAELRERNKGDVVTASHPISVLTDPESVEPLKADSSGMFSNSQDRETPWSVLCKNTLDSSKEGKNITQHVPLTDTRSPVMDVYEATLTYAMDRVHVNSSSPVSGSGEFEPAVPTAEDVPVVPVQKVEGGSRRPSLITSLPVLHPTPSSIHSEGLSLTEVINNAYNANARSSRTALSNREVIDLTSDPPEEEDVVMHDRPLHADSITSREPPRAVTNDSQSSHDTNTADFQHAQISTLSVCSLPGPLPSAQPSISNSQQVRAKLGLDQIRSFRSRLASQQLAISSPPTENDFSSGSNTSPVPATIERPVQSVVSEAIASSADIASAPRFQKLNVSLCPASGPLPLPPESRSTIASNVVTSTVSPSHSPRQVETLRSGSDRTDHRAKEDMSASIPSGEASATMQVSIGQQLDDKSPFESQREDEEELECLEMLTYPDSTDAQDTGDIGSDMDVSDGLLSTASASKRERREHSSVSSVELTAVRRSRRLDRRSQSSSSSSFGPVESIDDVPASVEARIRIRRNDSNGLTDTQLIQESTLLECGDLELLTWEKDHSHMMAKEFADAYKLAKDLPHEIQDRLNAMPLSARRADNLQVKLFEALISENTADDEPFAPAIYVINNVDDELTPPWEFNYSNLMWHGEGVPKPDWENLKGCGCLGPCDPKSKTCSCIKRQREYSDRGGFIYDQRGRLLVHEYPIFECNDLCGCSPECMNRVVQHGRKHAVNIQKTANKGWGVFVRDKRIPKNTFIGIYAGEFITDAETELRGSVYNKFGRTYLFDLDFHYLQTSEDWETKYCVDAYHSGNFTRYMNHSCDPNCNINACYINEANVEKPLLVMFTSRDVEPGEELCFAYFGNADDDDEQQDGRDPNDGIYVPCQCGTKKCKGRMWR